MYNQTCTYESFTWMNSNGTINIFTRDMIRFPLVKSIPTNSGEEQVSFKLIEHSTGLILVSEMILEKSRVERSSNYPVIDLVVRVGYDSRYPL